MRKFIIALFVAASLGGCANSPLVVTPSPGQPVNVLQTPEGQIKFGADTITAISTTATGLLRNHVMTLQQAEGLNALLHGAGDALDRANVILVACRAENPGSAGKLPDPCKPGVNELIVLSLDTIANVKRTVDSKK